MSTFALPMTGLDVANKLSNEQPQDFELRGVFIHPDHLASGFFADEVCSSSYSDTSSLIGYDDENPSTTMKDAFTPPTEKLTGLALSCGPSSDAQEEMRDYFAPRLGSSNPSPFYSSETAFTNPFSAYNDASASSSAATTPTCETTPDLSRRSSCASIYSEMTSPTLPATFSFASFAPSASPRLPSPTRPHPYSRTSKGGASMSRSISTPVETQYQVERRQQALSTAEVAMDERAVKMARSKSTASTPMLGSAPFGGVSMSRSSSYKKELFSPLATSFGTDWGAALPPRELPSPAVATFPYSVARPPTSPHRNARAHSFAGTENMYAANAPPMSSPNLSAQSSAALARSARRQSRLFAFTPILPQSPEPVSSSSCAMEVSSPPRTRLQRGMTF